MRHDYNYNSIHQGVSLLMDGGKPYSFDGVLWRPPGVAAYGARLDEIYRFGLGFGSIQNRTGATIVCGIGGRVHPTHWKAGQWVNATTTFTDDTVDAQDVGANDFPLETLTANDGFLVASLRPINAICLDIGTAGVGTGPVRTIEYSIAGGSWAPITNALIPPLAASHWAVGEALILWQHPSDLAPMVAGHGTGVPVGWYGYRFRSTTPPGTTAAVANSMSVAEIILPIEGLADNNIYEINPTGEYYLNNAYDSLVALLSSKAAIQSTVNIDARVL